MHDHLRILDEADEGAIGLGCGDEELADAGSDQADGDVQRGPLAHEGDPGGRALRLVEHQR